MERSPQAVTAFVVDTPTPELSRIVQQAAFAAGYRWKSAAHAPEPEFTDAPALVFCVNPVLMLFSEIPEASKKRSGRVSYTLSQALAFFKTGKPGNGDIDCTIPEGEP